jgi:hypothetical protein
MEAKTRKRKDESEKARPAGLEPATAWFEATNSIQLSYGREAAASLRAEGGKVNVLAK